MAPLGDEGLDWRPIAPQAKTFWTISVSIPIVVVFLVSAVTGLALSLPLLTAGSVVVGALVWAWARWIVVRRWRSWGYAERDSDLLLRRGVLFQRFTVVPYGRMQFVDVTQGPLDRWLGVSTVTLHTAAAASDAAIPLLPTDEAHRLRERLVMLGDVRAAGL